MHDTETNAHSLCKACGLCCDGTLFDHARLAPEDDRGVVDAAGIRLRDDRTSFHLPCPAYKDICTIYDDRLRICGEFRCNLLIKYMEGTAGYEAAFEIISRVKALSSKLRKQMADITGQDGQPLRSAYMTVRAIGDDSHRAMLLDYAVLLHHIRKHFAKSRSGA